MLITQGWENDLQVYRFLVHIELIGDKIWIHRDGLKDGIALDLVNAGIPKNQIILGFNPPEVRPYREFAVN